MTTNRVQQMIRVQEEGLALFERKNADYGDAFATYGPIGVLIRLGDKIQRLNSVTKSGVQLVDSESVRDTLIDLHNYAAMAIMLLDEQEQETAAQHSLKAEDKNDIEGYLSLVMEHLG